MLRIDWDTQAREWISNAAYIKIRTGRSRAYRNKLASLAAQNPSRAARIQQDITQVLVKLSENGGTAMLMPNIPEITLMDFSDFAMLIGAGIVVTGVSPQGRTQGEFRLVIVMECEAEAMLCEVFILDKYVALAVRI
jgi:hypothetical protein